VIVALGAEAFNALAGLEPIRAKLSTKAPYAVAQRSEPRISDNGRIEARGYSPKSRAAWVVNVGGSSLPSPSMDQSVSARAAAGDNRLSLDTGVLVIFDRRPNAAPIAERTRFEKATSPSGRPITVLRA